jgi:hypothetical protein
LERARDGAGPPGGCNGAGAAGEGARRGRGLPGRGARWEQGAAGKKTGDPNSGDHRLQDLGHHGKRERGGEEVAALEN